MVSVEIVLVRHARPFPPEVGGPDDYRRSLTEDGLAQALGLVESLAEPVPSLIASSPYLRAVQTVTPLARAVGLSVQLDDSLREWDSGLHPTPDYAQYHEESWASPGFARAGGESLRALSDRAVGVLVRLAASGVVVVGSHGTFIGRALVGFGRVDVGWSFVRAMPMPAVYRLQFSGNVVDVVGPGL